ncbi:MAG: NAD(P)/FAD-dependent oxidoreductase [Myxococcota bacterium]|nr:NAD(P)/FAD-dependent oxidoreductase [Myxococcota bacterium]
MVWFNTFDIEQATSGLSSERGDSMSLTQRKVDVVIVGGGPAGLACAIALAKRRLFVTVVDKKQWPIDKVCGEGLMPCGVETLDRMGIFEQIDHDSLRAFYGIRWICDQGAIAQANFDSGVGYGIRRTGLSDALYKAAQDSPYVTLMESTQLLAIESFESHVDIKLRGIDGQFGMKAAVVIGADGRNSKVRKLLKLDGSPAVRDKRWGARQHFQVTPWTNHVEVYWSNGIEAYVTPSSESRVEVAFLWDKSRFKPARAGRNLMSVLLKNFPQLERRVSGCKTVSNQQATGPLAVQAKVATQDRTILLGDALGYVDGITGEGLSVALQQAEVVAHELPILVRTNRLGADDLSGLGRRIFRIYWKSVRMVKLALVLARVPLLRRLAIRGLSRSPGLLTHFLEANMGKRAVWKLPLQHVPAFLAGLVMPLRSQGQNRLENTARALGHEQSGATRTLDLS